MLAPRARKVSPKALESLSCALLHLPCLRLSGSESESGEVAMDFSVTNEGDYPSQCVPATQFGNTGNFNNAPTFLQYVSPEGDDFEPGGIEFAMESEVEVGCDSTVQQSSAASG